MSTLAADLTDHLSSASSTGLATGRHCRTRRPSSYHSGESASLDSGAGQSKALCGTIAPGGGNGNATSRRSYRSRPRTHVNTFLGAANCLSHTLSGRRLPHVPKPSFANTNGPLVGKRTSRMRLQVHADNSITMPAETHTMQEPRTNKFKT